MRSSFLRCGALALIVFLVTASVPRDVGAAGEPYVIGATVSESGPGATLGRPEADSIQLAVDEINKAGGINGHQVQLTILDDESNPTTAVNNLRKLLDSKPIAILGSTLTQTSMAMVPIVQQASIPMISFGSSAQIIEPASEHPWVFKMPMTDSHIAELMQAFMKKAGQTKVALIYRDDDYGKTGLGHFENMGKANGFNVIDAEPIAATASDATTQATHVKGANPQAVVVWSTLPSVSVVIKGYRELSLPYPIYFSDGAANQVFLNQAGDALNGAYIATTKINVVDQLPAGDAQKKVIERYIAAWNANDAKDGPPNIFGGFGYDGVFVLKAALESAKSAEPAKLREALEHVTYSGVSGTFHLSPSDHNGLSVESAVMTQVAGGKFKLVK